MNKNNHNDSFKTFILNFFKHILSIITPFKIRQNKRFSDLIYVFRFYLILKPILAKQLNLKVNHLKLNTNLNKKRILIPLIETSHYQYLQILIIAKSLQLRGADVKVLVCDGSLDACEIKSIKNIHNTNPCFKCKFNVKNILPLYNLEIIKLKDFNINQDKIIYNKKINNSNENIETNLFQNGIDLTQSIEDSVIRYYYGNLPSDINEIDKIKIKHSQTANLMLNIANTIDKIWHPDIVLNGMYCYSSWEPFYKYYFNFGDRFKSLSITAFDFNKIVYNSFELYTTSKRYLKYLNARKTINLFKFEEEILDHFINERFKGRTEIFIKEKYYDNSINNDKLLSLLKINPNTKNIFIFSNIHWDIGLSECSDLYPDVISWVLDTINLCKGLNGVHLYIKPHPGEVFDSSSSMKSMSQIIEDKFPNLPNNITIILPEWKIKTYDLFNFIDLGIIFNGTIGLEMMLSGIPVVSTGKTSHYGLELSHEPSSKEEYLKLILNLNRNTKIDIKKVRMFAYFYFIRTLLPFDLTQKVYADDFKNGYTFNNLSDLEVGKNKSLDHLCSCILNNEIVPEIW